MAQSREGLMGHEKTGQGRRLEGVPSVGTGGVVAVMGVSDRQDK
jgi:hypothetical protein